MRPYLKYVVRSKSLSCFSKTDKKKSCLSKVVERRIGRWLGWLQVLNEIVVYEIKIGKMEKCGIQEDECEEEMGYGGTCLKQMESMIPYLQMSNGKSHFGNEL